MLAKKLMGATAAKPQLFVDEVMSTFLYTGNGSTQTINNGIDLAGEGGLVWTKNRTYGADHILYDTSRGAGYAKQLSINRTNAQGSISGDYLTGFLGNGYSLQAIGAAADNPMNASGSSYASWTFRRAPKFFDIVTYTGNGASNRQIAHDLGAEPGFITTKSTSTTGDWNTSHRSATGDLVLNSSVAQTGSRAIITAASESTFTVSGVANTNGVQYVAYLWAHDPSEDGIVQCGSFTSNGSTSVNVELGWEPQFIMYKAASTTMDWIMLDTMRDLGADKINRNVLYANSNSAEQLYATPGQINATGFSVQGIFAGNTVVYLAIRRPNKPPTSGTEVYNAIARTGTGAAATVTGVGFTPDLVIAKERVGAALLGPICFDRLRGATKYLLSPSTGAEAAGTNALIGFDAMDGVVLGTDSTTASINYSGITYANWFFRRAPGFHDQICYTGTGANKTEAHNLTKAPELWLAKRRNAPGSWVWGSTLLNANEKIVMPSVNGRVTDATAWDSTYPTATNISLGTLAGVNASGGTYTLYMWATLAGISKVGTYTGNGSSQTIDCGFTTGARFVMIIRMTASTAQDIYLWDSARGITSGNDPRLSLNTTAAEVTDLDTIDPAASGFIVNTDASNVNVNGAQYLYLAIS